MLYNEVEFMLKQELRETATYYTIIEAVALGNTKINDIYTKTQIDKSKINVYLKNLMDLNIIEREYPVTDSIKKKVSGKGGLYKIRDNYFKFYFKFIFPSISELEEGDIDGIYKYTVEPFLNEYVSFIFEDICIQYMRRLNMSDKLPFHFSKIGRWWNKKNEIDIAAFDAHGNLICGECKWKNSSVGISELNALKEKSIFVDGKYTDKYYYMFSKNSFDKELIKLSKSDKSVFLIDLNDMMQI